jgi:hypothetical protein
MGWSLSRYRTGDVVEVRSREEILAVLDQRSCTDSMPFMPEMLQYCGKRFRVSAVAHKACDMIGKPGTSRRLNGTVHLAGLRCDGSAHGGCQAECNLFWKDEWLRAIDDNHRVSAKRAAPINSLVRGSTEVQLLANTLLPSGTIGEESLYSCQATRMYEATRLLAWWDMRQYVFDVVTRNRSLGRVSRVLFLATLRWLLPRVPRGYRVFKGFHDRMHNWLTGRPSPSLNGRVPDGAQTPTGRLQLEPGEYVRIKTQMEIEQTVNKKGKNRGLTFDPEEMAPYCGRIFRVRKSVTKIIDEPSGKMLYMKQPCIMLEGVVCNSEYAKCRLNCPRAIPSYWREIWLERVQGNEFSNDELNHRHAAR